MVLAQLHCLPASHQQHAGVARVGNQQLALALLGRSGEERRGEERRGGGEKTRKADEQE
jgi:hypothetical protein